MSFGHALYYPHINLTNKNWLKYALLFWDKISRIVPGSITPSDSEDVIKIRSEFDFIEDYHPDRWDTSSVAREFLGILRHLIRTPDFLEYYELDRPEVFEMLTRLDRFTSSSLRHRAFTTLNAMARERGVYIHVEKLDRELKEYLYRTGLGIPGDREWSDWLRIDGDLGMLYMSYLATTIGKRTARPTVSDSASCFGGSIALQNIAAGHLRHPVAELECGLGNFLIASYAPKDMNAVTFDQLIKFRKKYDDQRIGFFNSVSEFCRAIPAVENEDQLKDAINHHAKNLQKQTVDLKKQFEGMRIEPVLRFIGISMPTACTSAIEYIPNVADPFILGGGVLLGLAGAASSYSKDRSALQDKPLAYLLSLHAELDSRSFFEKLTDNIQGITRW